MPQIYSDRYGHRRPPKNHRLRRARRRKAQRQARRLARLCAAGRKHQHRKYRQQYGRP